VVRRESGKPGGGRGKDYEGEEKALSEGYRTSVFAKKTSKGENRDLAGAVG